MASPPPSLGKLQSAVEGAMDELQVKHIIPMQKENFVCSARCCDQNPKNMVAIQECTLSCQDKVHAAHQLLFGQLEDFQSRFKRCLQRCDDAARELLPAVDAKEADIKRAQAHQLGCMEQCAGEYAGKVPKMKADLHAGLAKLAKQ